jgi:hypothetical protein
LRVLKRSVWLLILPAWLGCEAITDFDRDRIEMMTVPPTVLPPALDAGRRDAGSDTGLGDADLALDGALPERDGEVGDATDDATPADGGGEDASATVDAGDPDSGQSDAGPLALLDGGMDASSDMDAALEAGAMDAELDAGDAARDAAGDGATAADAAGADAASDAALDASDAQPDANGDAAAAHDAEGPG